MIKGENYFPLFRVEAYLETTTFFYQKKLPPP